MPAWAAPAPGTATARPDRPPAGHARLSLSPAVRAVASVAGCRAGCSLPGCSALAPCDPQVARAAEYSMVTAATYDVAPGEGHVRVSDRRQLPQHDTRPARAVQRVPGHRPGGARGRAETSAPTDGTRAASAGDARSERGGVNGGQRPAATSAVRYRDSARFTLSYTLADGGQPRRAHPAVGGEVPGVELRHAGHGRGPAPRRLRGAGRRRPVARRAGPADAGSWRAARSTTPRRWLALRDSDPAVELRHAWSAGAAERRALSTCRSARGPMTAPGAPHAPPADRRAAAAGTRRSGSRTAPRGPLVMVESLPASGA